MLKPVDPALGAPGPAERPVGELVHQLVEDGKAYAQAEVAVVKAIAAAKGKALALPVGLFGAAFLLLIAAMAALALGVVLALAKFIGPLLAGIAGLLIFGAIAGLLAWVAIQKVRQGL